MGKFLLPLFLIASVCTGQDLTKKVFDVHLHGSRDVDEQLRALKSNGVYRVAVSSSWALQQKYQDGPSLEVLHGLMLPCPEGRVPYSRQNCFAGGEEWPDLEWVEKLMAEGKIDFLGEVLSQYFGISLSDSLMLPYYALAQKYDVPVGVHTGSAGPDHGCPNFEEHLGDPSPLTAVVEKFPALRVWIMHAGGPFLRQTVEVMKKHPNVYVDISAINNPDILPPAVFAETIKHLLDQGLEDRIMFGSDNGDIAVMIRSLTQLPFLTDRQKEKILFANAERFFRVPRRK